MFCPGANKSTTRPKLENSARASAMVLAPTVTTLGARAGEVSFALTLEFPAATWKYRALLGPKRDVEMNGAHSNMDAGFSELVWRKIMRLCLHSDAGKTHSSDGVV